MGVKPKPEPMSSGQPGWQPGSDDGSHQLSLKS